MSLLTEIPGYAEAVNAEQANRELAFLPSPPPICGVPIRHLNARHHILLVGCGNRFLCGGRPTKGDVAMFLWFLSPEYTAGEPGKLEFVKRVAESLNYRRAATEIFQYVERVWQDAPAGSGGDGKAYTASVASIVDFLASQYGWTDEAILEMPLARVFQYLRRIQMRINPRAIMFNGSDRVIGQWLAERNRQTSGSN